MSDTDTVQGMREELARRVDAIESAYELMLAYAAQGLPAGQASSSGQPLRDSLERFEGALKGLADLYRSLIDAEQPDRRNAYDNFLGVLARDADASRAGLQVVLAQPAISSQLVDNLNASIHIRALLTDVFLIDELLKQVR